MTEEAQLQQAWIELQALNEAGKQAYGHLPRHPNLAYAAFEQAVAAGNAWASRWLELLQRQPMLVQPAVDSGAWLLMGQGQSAGLMGMLTEARKAFENALALPLDPTNPMRLTLLEALAGQLCREGKMTEAEERFRAVAQGCASTGTGDWLSAARCRAAAATCFLSLGRPREYQQGLQEAIQIAHDHGLADFERQQGRKLVLSRLRSDPRGETLAELTDDAGRQQLQRKLGLDAIELALLAAEVWAYRGEWEKAYLEYQKAAKATSGADSDQRYHLLLDWSACCEALGDIAEGIQHADEALEIAQGHTYAEWISVARRTLVGLLAAGGPQYEAALRKHLDLLRTPGNAAGDLFQALQSCALAHMGAGQFAEALADLAQAGDIASTPVEQAQVWEGRTAALLKLERFSEALQANVQAIELLAGPAGIADPAAATNSAAMANSLATLCSNAAYLLARSNQLDQALLYAEHGKARRLRAELAQIRSLDETVLPIPSVAALRALLREESAAIAFFWVTQSKTVVIVMDPWADKPATFLAPGDRDLQQMLRAPAEQGEVQWTERDLQAMSSSLIQTPLQETARRVQANRGVLYLVPDSRLFFTPFAALTLDDGTPLLECCPLAYVPSAAVLDWCRRRRQEAAVGEFLIAGAGSVLAEDGKSYSFADQAERVRCSLGGGKLLREPTAAEVLQAMQQAGPLRVMHLECHGHVLRDSPGVLLAAQLEFAQRTCLTAREVFELRGGLHADLVFLNACTSGGFPLRTGGEVGGFWEAFLHAGASTLIATLRHVHPEAATHLVQEFYHGWPRGGLTKAAALRAAQLAVRARDPNPALWATHILVGDHR